MPKLKFETYDCLRTDNPKFQHLVGKAKMSYSAYTSWKELKYRGEFIAQKFLKEVVAGGMFADYGSACGEFIEHSGDVAKVRAEIAHLLSESDIAILTGVVDSATEGSEYEREIVLDRGDYVIHGFIDECSILDDASLFVKDFKTGNDKKVKMYSDFKQYQQTGLYAHALIQEGEHVGGCGVVLLDRKGNNTTVGDKNVLRLTGTITDVPTPYDPEATEAWLKKDFDKVAKEISDFRRFYNKFFPV